MDDQEIPVVEYQFKLIGFKDVERWGKIRVRWVCIRCDTTFDIIRKTVNEQKEPHYCPDCGNGGE